MNCAVISQDPTLRGSVAEALDDGRVGIRLASTLSAPIGTLGRDVAEDLRRAGVQVVVLDLSEDVALGLRFARFLSEEISGVTFVLLGPSDVPPAMLLEAMRVGASEYLKTPHEFAELSAALNRAARRIGAAPAPEAHEPGRIFVFFAAKGGTGVTTAAANFAVSLHDATERRTVLVDLDLELGGAAILLGLHPRYTFGDFVNNLHRMDRNLLESLVDHHDTGIDVLASPGSPNDGASLSKDQVRQALNYLRRNYENIVVDLSRVVTPITLTALERADEVLLLTTPDVPSLRNTKKVLPIVRRTVKGNDRIRLVVNRRRSQSLIQGSDVREALGVDVFWSLSEDDENVTTSANEGRPVVGRQKSRYSKDIQGLVQQLAVTVNGKGSSGGFSGLFRPFRRSGKE